MMTPYQLLQVERDRKWHRRRLKLLKQFASTSEKVLLGMYLDWVTNRQTSYLSSYGLRCDWSMEAIQRQLWAVRHPHARFKLIKPYYKGAPLKPKFDDENEMLYLLSV